MTRSLALLASLAAACGPDKNDDTGGGGSSGEVGTYLSSVGDVDLSSEDGAAFAASTSAGSVLTLALLPVYLASFTSDGVCPQLVEDETSQDIIGDCTAADGTVWYGSYHSEGNETSGDGTLDGFGFAATSEDCPGKEQSYVVTGTLAATAAVADQNIDLQVLVDFTGPDASCNALSYRYGIDYALVMANQGKDSVYSGTGKVGAEGMGAVDTTTADELVASCGTEPDSGSLTVVSGGDTMVVTYDGASQCTDPGEAPYTLNGTDMGTIAVSSCATAPGARGFFLALLAGLLALGRRRR